MLPRSRAAAALAFLSLLMLIAASTAIMSPRAKADTVGSWSLSAGGGFGEGADTFAAVPLVEFQGSLYAGTMGEHGAQVWRLEDDDTWEKVADGGFGDSDNIGIVRMQVFGSHLYAGTLNLEGCGLWRYDGNTWTDAMASCGPGFGDADNLGVTAMEVYNGVLYAGTLNYSYDNLFDIDGGHIWSSADGTAWTQLIGQEWLGNKAPGFGDSMNLGITSLRASNGTLYAGTARMQLAVGIIDGSHLSLTLSGRGCELWRKGTTSWTKCQGGGFGDERNAAILGMEPFGGKLFIGTTNGDLGVTVNTDTGEVSDVTYTSNGLGVYSYDGSEVASEHLGGFGDTDDFCVTSMCATAAWGGNKLLVGAANADGPGKLQVYDGSTWRPAADDGFGSADNNAVSAVSMSGDSAYAGTVNTEAGCEVWQGTPPLPPEIDSIVPPSGPVGTPVTISGRNFGASRGSSSVEFNSVEAVEFTEWSDEEIVAAVPPGATTGPVTVTTAEGSSNGMAFTVIFPPEIDTISPASGPAGTEIKLTGSHFGTSRGPSYVEFGGVKATSYPEWNDSLVRVAVPYGAPGGMVTVTTAAGTSNGVGFTVKSATPEPEPEPEPMQYPTWYLAEGTCAWGFDTYISIANPNSSAVNADINYNTGAGPVSGGTVTLPPRSQTTVNPKGILGEKDFSTKVECKEGKTIAVDRTMIWTGTDAASPEAHCSVGVTAPAKAWYLPEGSSAWGFETWLLIQNPGTRDASVTVTYMIEGEGPVPVQKTVPASSRASFNMETDIGQKDASIKVEASVPVIPERAMYRNSRREGHCSIGTTTPARDYYLAEGTTGYGFTTYVLVQNPNDTPADVDVTYMTGSGPVTVPTFQMPARSRKTINVNATATLPDPNFSTKVHGSQPIIAERAMYWDNGTGEACHDSVGMSAPHTTFYLPDGETSNGRETWTLVQNPNTSAVSVEITYMTPTGNGNVVKTEAIPASSRKTFSMVEHSGITGRAAIMVKSKTKDRKIMVERAMYWGDGRTSGTVTIGGFSD